MKISGAKLIIEKKGLCKKKVLVKQLHQKIWRKHKNVPS